MGKSDRAQRVGAAPTGRRWRRRLLLALLGLFSLAVGFLLTWLWTLDGHVRARFESLQWQEPTRVYARPLRLYPGLPMRAEVLEQELRAAAYRPVEAAPVPGTYERSGNRFRIHRRAFVDLDGPLPARSARVQLVGAVISDLRDASSDRRLHEFRIDPARIATFYGDKREERRLLRLEQVPELVVTGLQAVEDRDFKFHRGVDPWGVLRALWVNLRSGAARQGGSTLTQQLARGLFLSTEQSLRRKVTEALYALIIEARYDKKRILEAYLNDVYLGQQGNQVVRGVGAGAEYWFGRSLDQLRLPEVALLIGLIQGPSYLDPRRHPERARARRALVLRMMFETGLIDAKARDAALAAPLGVSARPSLVANRYPAFIDLVTAQLARDYDAATLRGAGLSILTTLEPGAQWALELAAEGTLAALQRKGRPPLQIGAVVSSVDSGAVLAMLGDRDPDAQGFNRAMLARRPIGSLIKPFVYMLALAQPERWSLASYIDDAPISVPLARGQIWKPENYDGRSHGRVRLIDALALSYNQATVRLGLDVGVDRVVRLLAALANIDAAAHPSLLLGAIDLDPLRVTQLYQFLASSGRVQPLFAVRGVLDDKGALVQRYEKKAPPAQRGDSIATRLIGIALQHAVEAGTARALLADGLGRLSPAGKTGTSNDNRDSWFAGWSGSQLAVIWVGDDQNRPTGLQGATGAMRVWSSLYRKMPSRALSISGSDLEWVWTAADELARTAPECSGARLFPFIAGYAPSEFRGCIYDRLRALFGADDEDGR